MSPAAAGGKKMAAAQVTKAEAAVAKENRGIMRPVPVSEALRRFAGGAPEISRANAVKLVWAHIKANSLQVSTSLPPAAALVGCYYLSLFTA